MLVHIKAFVVIIVVNMTAMALHWPVIWHYTVIYPPQSKYLLSTVEANMVFFFKDRSLSLESSSLTDASASGERHRSIEAELLESIPRVSGTPPPTASYSCRNNGFITKNLAARWGCLQKYTNSLLTRLMFYIIYQFS